MGRRDDRLHTPEAFRQALMTRPVSRKGSFLVYRISSPDGARIGFVIPKKLVRNAVQRNQIKRWARAIFRQSDHTARTSFALVVRVNRALASKEWMTHGRHQAKQDLGAALVEALAFKPANQT